MDRDRGPGPDGEWPRKGVMQFHHPHFFRPQVRFALLAQMPDVEAAVVDAGAVLTSFDPSMPDILGYRVRRSTFERTLRTCVMKELGVTHVAGHAERVVTEANKVTGLVVDGRTIKADLVVDAAGRSGRFTDDLRSPAEGGDCGFAYVTRHYRLRDGAEPGPTNSPPGWAGHFDGYLAIVFIQDAGTFQTLIVRSSADSELAKLRDEAAFDLAVNAVPLFAAWVDPARAEPISAPMAGAGLQNLYRGQLDANGAPAADGLLFVGDSVLTTNPAAGRGFTTSLLQAQRALALMDEHGSDLHSVALAFDSWCEENMKPWFHDHVRWDASLLSRWRGEDVDFSKPLSSDLICSVAQIDPTVGPMVGAYQAMVAGPSILGGIEQRAREAFQSGFRPSLPDGPTRDELVELIASADPVRTQRPKIASPDLS